MWEIVYNMLYVESQSQLNPKLVQYLQEIEYYCEKVEGHISSRQIVALSLATWKQLYPNEEFHNSDHKGFYSPK